MYKVSFTVQVPDLDRMSDYLEELVTKAMQEAKKETIISLVGPVKAVKMNLNNREE